MCLIIKHLALSLICWPKQIWANSLKFIRLPRIFFCFIHASEAVWGCIKWHLLKVTEEIDQNLWMRSYIAAFFKDMRMQYLNERMQSKRKASIQWNTCPSNLQATFRTFVSYIQNLRKNERIQWAINPLTPTYCLVHFCGKASPNWKIVSLPTNFFL